jgi:ribose transport system substrate-binding protein
VPLIRGYTRRKLLMKKKFALFFMLLFSVLFISCGINGNKTNLVYTPNSQNNVTPTNETEPKIKNIALVMKTLTNPFFIEMEKGARRAEKEFGIHLVVKTGAQEISVDQQIAIVNELIMTKINAIVIAPGDSKKLIPILKKAQDAGIIIVNIDNKLDVEMSNEIGLKDVPFISVDNEQASYLSALTISKMINTPTDVVIIEGIRSANNAEMRKKGAQRAFSENKNIKIVATETANWKIDEANTIIKSLFGKYPNIKAIFAANDMMGLGVVEYLKTVNKKGVLLSAFDNLPEANKAIKEGWMVATIDQQPDMQGYTGIKYAIKMLGGEKMPNETIIDVKVIDFSNAQN